MNFNNAIPNPTGSGGGLGAFGTGVAAAEYEVVPAGIYTARVL